MISERSFGEGLVAMEYQKLGTLNHTNPCNERLQVKLIGQNYILCDEHILVVLDFLTLPFVGAHHSAPISQTHEHLFLLMNAQP